MCAFSVLVSVALIADSIAQPLFALTAASDRDLVLGQVQDTDSVIVVNQSAGVDPDVLA